MLWLVHRVFMLFTSVPQGIDVWLSPHVFLVVDSSFDLGRKLNTRKRVLRIF